MSWASNVGFTPSEGCCLGVWVPVGDSHVESHLPYRQAAGCPCPLNDTATRAPSRYRPCAAYWQDPESCKFHIPWQSHRQRHSGRSVLLWVTWGGKKCSGLTDLVVVILSNYYIANLKLTQRHMLISAQSSWRNKRSALGRGNLPADLEEQFLKPCLGEALCEKTHKMLLRVLNDFEELEV